MTAGRLSLLVAPLLAACSEAPPPPPAASSGATAAPTATQTPALTTGTLRGVVTLTDSAPEMKVPVTRKDADVCKAKPIPHNAVLVKDGTLKDVLVRIAPGTIMGIGCGSPATQGAPRFRRPLGRRR